MNRGGFTLIEVLVALFIFAIIATIATGVLHHSITVKSVLQKRQDTLISQQAIKTKLQNILSHAVDYQGLDNTNGFKGTDDSISLVSLQSDMNGSQLIPEIRTVTLELDEQQLIESFNTGNRRVLADNVSELSLAYQDCRGNLRTDWQSSEQDDSSAHLPCVIEVNLTQAGHHLQLVIPIVGGNIE